MPPRVVHGPNQAGGLGAFVESLPPVTRFMAGTIFAVSLGMYVGLVHPATLALFWPAITKNYQVGACERMCRLLVLQGRSRIRLQADGG